MVRQTPEKMLPGLGVHRTGAATINNHALGEPLMAEGNVLYKVQWERENLERKYMMQAKKNMKRK